MTTDQNVYEYMFNIFPSKMDIQIVDGAEKCPIVKQTNSKKSHDIFSPGEYAILTNIVYIQAKEEGGTKDTVLQSRSSN